LNQESILNKIRTLRHKNGYSQEYMAIKLKIRQSDYNKLENGKTELTINKIVAIAKILEIESKILIA